MTRWARYEPFLLTGLWHVHTDRTDGANTVPELVAFAAEHGFPLIAITEHVRRDLDYDFDALYAEAKARADERALTCLVGCETKVLDESGTLDASPATLDRADIVYAAYHGTPFSNEAYLESIPAMLANPAVDVWAHPFDYLDRRGYTVTADQLDGVLDAIRTNEVLFELNLRRPLPRVVRWRDLRHLRKIIGHDLHDIAQWTGTPGGPDSTD